MTDIALDETPAEEFSRLVIEYNEGKGSEREEAWNLIADFALEHCDAMLRGLFPSPSQVAPQPQASEAQQPTAFIQKEVLDVLMKDKTATGSVSSGLLRKPFGNPVPLYASPQPANPAQVTLPDDDEPKNWRDLAEAAIMDLRRYANDELPHRRLVSADAYKERFRLLTAAIGAGGQAVAVKSLEWSEDRDDDGTKIHRTRGGEVNLPYTVYEDGFIKKPFGLSLNQLRIGSFDTVVEAKAAAQKDYERRILAALSATEGRKPLKAIGDDPYVCPDCGRDKALTANDAANGLCPKWWAIRDADAEHDCRNYVKEGR